MKRHAALLNRAMATFDTAPVGISHRTMQSRAVKLAASPTFWLTQALHRTRKRAFGPPA